MTTRRDEIEKATKNLRITAGEVGLREILLRSETDSHKELEKLKSLMFIDGAEWADKNPLPDKKASHVIAEFTIKLATYQRDHKLMREALEYAIEIRKRNHPIPALKICEVLAKLEVKE